jgi:hypothetical protein
MTLWQLLDRRAERRERARLARPARRSLSFRDFLAVFLINAFVVALFYLLGRAFPQQNEQLIVYMLGQLSGFTGTAVALYFTADRHEDRRAEDAAKLTTAAADIAATARASTGDQAARAAEETALAAERKADEFRGSPPLAQRGD